MNFCKITNLFCVLILLWGCIARAEYIENNFSVEFSFDFAGIVGKNEFLFSGVGYKAKPGDPEDFLRAVQMNNGNAQGLFGVALGYVSIPTGLSANIEVFFNSLSLYSDGVYVNDFFGNPQTDSWHSDNWGLICNFGIHTLASRKHRSDSKIGLDASLGLGMIQYNNIDGTFAFFDQYHDISAGYAPYFVVFGRFNEYSGRSLLLKAKVGVEYILGLTTTFGIGLVGMWSSPVDHLDKGAVAMRGVLSNSIVADFFEQTADISVSALMLGAFEFKYGVYF